MAQLLTDAGAVFEKVIELISSLCETVMGQPILMIGVILMMIGFVVGICKRLISTF